MWSSSPLSGLRLCLAASALSLLALAAGCGYGFSGTSVIILPESMTKLAFEKLVNPSTEPWLEPRMRTEIRQELARRGQVEWVETAQAQGLLEVDISRFSSSARLEDAQGQTVKSEVVLDIRARLFRQSNRELVWRSGTITATKSFVGPEESSQEREAQEEAVELAVERLVDRMNQAF